MRLPEIISGSSSRAMGHSMVDCLASTGPDHTILLMVLGAVLVTAGLVTFALIRKRNGLAALAILPLLLGLSLAGPNVQPAQAATSASCATATPTPTPTPTATPSEPPVCEPTTTFESISPETDRFFQGFSDNTPQYFSSWSEADAPSIEALLDASTSTTLSSTVTATVRFYPPDQEESYVETYSYETTDSSIQVADFEVVTPASGLTDLINEAHPDSEDYYEIETINIAFSVPYDTGCGPAVATITFDAAFMQID